MAEHLCQYIIKWPATQDDTTVHCDQPAPIRRSYTSLTGDIRGMWLCVTHFDQIEATLAATGVSPWTRNFGVKW
jgi:hypothetical protein